MPAYNYQCFTCGAQEEIVGGLDDHVAHCTCGALMLRTDEDLFGPYFDAINCKLTRMLPPAPLPPTAS